jgi:hypothetical protein
MAHELATCWYNKGRSLQANLERLNYERGVGSENGFQFLLCLLPWTERPTPLTMINAPAQIDLTTSNLMEIIDTDDNPSELEINKLRRVRVAMISQYGSLPFSHNQKNRSLTAEKRILSQKVPIYSLMVNVGL